VAREGTRIHVMLAKGGDKHLPEHGSARVEVGVAKPVDETGGHVGSDEAEGEAEQRRRCVEAWEAEGEAEEERGCEGGGQGYAGAISDRDEAAHGCRVQ
jgi:hypothetical protein